MKLTDQVCTFEQAKILHNLGLEVQSFCYWIKYPGLDKGYLYTINGHIPIGNNLAQLEVYHGYTGMELEMMLPMNTMDVKDDGPGYIDVQIFKGTGGEYGWSYEPSYLEEDEEYLEFYPFRTPTEARADMLIWLIDVKKFIDPKTLTL